MSTRHDTAIRWIHLSDLHLGCKGEAVWWDVRDDFADSVTQMLEVVGPPDLVLMTGDLAYSGAALRADEYDLVDRFLAMLRETLERAGVERQPLLFAVPGNHDVARPSDARAVRQGGYAELRRYDDGDDELIQDLKEQLWQDRDASPVADLFTAYCAWQERVVLEPARADDRVVDLRPATPSMPGDLALVFQAPSGHRLGLVGLNSAWVQYGGGDYEGLLQLPAEQLHAALEKPGASPTGFFRDDCDHAFLLTHHPPSWLSPRALEVFRGHVDRARRFALHLFGHMHEARSEAVSVSGGATRFRFQSPSLFGLERYERSDESRPIGYVWGALSPAGEVRVWPLEHVVRASGTGEFDVDTSFSNREPDGSVVIRPADAGPDAPSPPRRRPVATRDATAPPPRVDLRPYLDALVRDVGSIEMLGITTEVGAAGEVVRRPIEELYTPLRASSGVRRALPGDPDEALRFFCHAGRGSLASVVAGAPRLLIEGAPGSGKSTFLKLVATSLARDHLAHAAPGGGTWRERFLGLDPGEPARIPALVRLGALASARRDARDASGRRPVLEDLLEHLAGCARSDGCPGMDAAGWREACVQGRAWLLVDALDEVGDPALRQSLLDLVSAAARDWPDCRITLTTRPLDQAPHLDGDFATATLAPFDLEDIEAFLARWVHALPGLAPDGDLSSEGAAYLGRLQDAVTGRPRIRELAANPVMLTCLAVIHRIEGELPEGRARVYGAIVRWLLRRRDQARERAAFSSYYAQRGLRLLALAMMEDGKRTIADLSWAADRLDAHTARHHEGLDRGDRRDATIEWLRFETTGSGVVEELPGGRVRFWHLTFQEYLAAREIAGLGDELEDSSGREGLSWWPRIRPRLDEPAWREVVDLFPGCLLGQGTERVDTLLDRVMALGGAGEDLAARAFSFGVLGRMLPHLRVYKYPVPAGVHAHMAAAREHVMGIFEPAAAAIPFATRLAAAEALGRAGDPRVPDGRPPTSPIPGLEPSPGLDPVELGRFPVTVAQFGAFVDAHGYERRDFWRDGDVASGEPEDEWLVREDWGWTGPGGWAEQQEHPNRPVIRVSWFEARAYCRFLSWQTGRQWRLPTQGEWEAAARRPDGDYPWGRDEPTPEHACFDRVVDHPVPVGLYPCGVAPGGHLDLAGNVWEWCADEVEPTRTPEWFIEQGYPDAWVRAARGPWRAVRGGAWGGPARHLRSARRAGAPASGRDVDLGVRVALSPEARSSRRRRRP